MVVRSLSAAVVVPSVVGRASMRSSSVVIGPPGVVGANGRAAVALVGEC